MTRIFYACLSLVLLTPSLASAQTADKPEITGLPTALSPSSGASTVTWGIQDCNNLPDDEQINFAWSIAGAGSEQFSVKVQQGSETCSTSSVSSGDDVCTSVATGELSDTVSATVTTAQLIGSSFDCFDEDNDGSYKVIFVHDQSGEDAATQAETFTFDFSLDRPTGPTDVEVSAGETALEVSWTAADGIDDYVVFYSTDVTELGNNTEPEQSTGFSKPATGTSITITDNVDGNSTYYVAVLSQRSADDNLSPFGELVSASTQPTLDFWEAYRAAGGAETGGCSSSKTGAPWMAGFAVLGLLFVSRRRKAAAGILAACLLIPGMAHAELTLVQDSPVSGAFELKLGRYTPSIDDEFTGSSPYDDTFGNRNPIYLELEYDYQLWREFGSLGAFFGVGWHQIKGSAFGEDGTVSDTDTTRMRTIPLRLGVVYRFDELHRRWNIPLAFSAKFGLDYYVWSIRDTDGTASTEIDGEQVSGRGGTSGYHFAFGAHLLLDFLAPGMASTFDLNTGVNNTYLFAEVTMAQINDFGSDTSFDLSDTTVLFGLAFEF